MDFAYWENYRSGTPIQQGYAVCEACGLDRSEVDGLVENMRDRLSEGMSREELLQAFYATFHDPVAGERVAVSMVC